MEILHSKIIGEGTPLLILHGYFGMGDNWKSLGNKFGKNFQTHIIDQRNHEIILFLFKIITSVPIEL